MRKLLLVIILLTGLFAFPQAENKKDLYFSEALSMYLPKYEKKARNAYRFNDYERGQFLFDSLVNNCLRNSYMDDFRFYNLKKKPVQLSDFTKPIYLITYASWCVQSKGEIPAINELANKYKDQIDFVVLFWDELGTVKDIAKEYNKNINVVYVDESKNSDPFIIKNLKHSLGLPTCFLISKDKRIEDIRRSVFLPYNTSAEDSYERNYKSIEEGISNHLLINTVGEVAGIAN